MDFDVKGATEVPESNFLSFLNDMKYEFDVDSTQVYGDFKSGDSALHYFPGLSGVGFNIKDVSYRKTKVDTLYKNRINASCDVEITDDFIYPKLAGYDIDASLSYISGDTLRVTLSNIPSIPDITFNSLTLLRIEVSPDSVRWEEDADATINIPGLGDLHVRAINSGNELVFELLDPTELDMKYKA